MNSVFSWLRFLRCGRNDNQNLLARNFGLICGHLRNLRIKAIDYRGDKAASQ